ncbi:hypothetical protein AX774_g5891, partial [Zancudomyces culisetae]
MSSFAKS